MLVSGFSFSLLSFFEVAEISSPICELKEQKFLHSVNRIRLIFFTNEHVHDTYAF